MKKPLNMTSQGKSQLEVGGGGGCLGIGCGCLGMDHAIYEFCPTLLPRHLGPATCIKKRERASDKTAKIFRN